MKLKPLFDKVVLKMNEAEETTKSGLILTGGGKEKPQTATVIAVGSGKLSKDGETEKMVVKAGDQVLLSKYAGDTVKVDGEEYLIVAQSEILAIVE